MSTRVHPSISRVLLHTDPSSRCSAQSLAPPPRPACLQRALHRPSVCPHTHHLGRVPLRPPDSASVLLCHDVPLLSPSPFTVVTMAAFVPTTAAAAACAWTPAATAVCAKRAATAPASAAIRLPGRRVRAGRVAVTAAAVEPVDVTADTFDAEVMESARAFMFLLLFPHCGLRVGCAWPTCGAVGRGGGG